MDLVIFLVLMVLVIFFFRKFSSFIYFIAIVDILLRIITFAKDQIAPDNIYIIINKYIPANIPVIIGNYSSGLLYTVLLWLYVSAFIIFEFYILRTFFRKK